MYVILRKFKEKIQKIRVIFVILLDFKTNGKRCIPKYL